MHDKSKAAALAAFAIVIAADTANAAEDLRDAAGLYAPSVWDLELGAHARELPREEFVDFACGTNGGPPSLPLTAWRDYANCRAEDGTGFHEVYFQYDDEPEYHAKARSLEHRIALYEYTSAYAIPIIASGLFNSAGFLRGFRMITDPRVPVEVREKGVTLSGYLKSRYGEDGWTCTDLPRREGEQAYQSWYEKKRCNKVDESGTLDLVMETHYYRRPGEAAIDPNRRQTTGQFESTTRFEARLVTAIPDDLDRLAEIVERSGPSERDLLAERARNCPGCDLGGADLKRANLAGANLAGANLAGANLHAAILTGADLSGANLAEANLNRVDARRVNLSAANLQNAMMYESRFDGANVSGADMTSAFAGKVQLIGADLSGAKMNFMDLRNARLNDATFVDADLSDSWMHDAQLARSNLSGARLLGVIAWKASLVEAKLVGADFQAADLYGVNMRAADLTAANLSYTRLSGVNFSEAELDGVNWLEATLPAGFEPK